MILPKMADVTVYESASAALGIYSAMTNSDRARVFIAGTMHAINDDYKV